MFADNPVLSAPGHEGERLLVTFKMSFAASYFHEGNSLGGMNLYFRSESSGPDFSTFASLELRRGWDFDGSPFVSDVLVPSGWGPGIAIGTDSFSISLGALGGSTIPLSVKLSTVVFLFGDGDVYVDAGNSAYWSGANVTTLDGQAVAFTLVGKNGIDYSQPITTVDEPQAAMTLSAGIALIAFMRRKRDGRVTRK